MEWKNNMNLALEYIENWQRSFDVRSGSFAEYFLPLRRYLCQNTSEIDV